MRYVLFMVLLVIVGCAAPAKKDFNPGEMNGVIPAGVTSRNLANNFARSENKFGYYYVEAYPYFDSLVDLQTREMGKAALKSDDQIEKDIKSNRAQLSNKCFMFTVGAQSIEAARFNYFAAKIIIGEKSIPLTFTNLKGADSVPSHSGIEGYRWVNFSQGCATESLDLTKGFTVVVSSILMTEAPQSNLQWIVADSVNSSK